MLNLPKKHFEKRQGMQFFVLKRGRCCHAAFQKGLVKFGKFFYQQEKGFTPAAFEKAFGKVYS
jgi:hypothetical protein